MAVDIHREIHQGLDEVTADRREFIRKAFHILPKLDRPRILDIGCGRGGPTLELARLSGGEVIGVDIDAQALDELAARAAVEGLSDTFEAGTARCRRWTLKKSPLTLSGRRHPYM